MGALPGYDVCGRLLGTETFGETRSFPIDGRGDCAVGCAGFSADGGRVIASLDPGSIRVWNTWSGREVCRFEGHEDFALHVSLSSDGGRALSLGEDEDENIVARLWDVGNGRGMRAFRVGEATRCAALSPDGRRVITGGWDDSVLLWEAESGREIRRLGGHEHAVTCVEWAPDGRQAISGGVDEVLRLWDVQGGMRASAPKPRRSPTVFPSGQIDGRLVLCNGGNGEVALLDVATGRLVRRLGGLLSAAHKTSPVRLAFSPDGRRALSGGGWSAGRAKDYSVRLWDVGSGRELRRFRGHGDGVLDVTFSSDGQLGLCAGADGLVRVSELPLF